ncbi:MAG: DNA-binding response regulator [Actinobacteria bacterium 69-20]|nr:response regulator transcription factor [Actinomycetota bacterium]OJV26146.1 MAG: DNA-binding response regulator [Actinobacteria bacterium 69-20]
MTPHVVIADDDRAIRESLQRALTLEGYRVTLAADGVQAAVAARGPDVDVIVLDVGMPTIDGLGVTRLLRAEGVTTPILMLTARVSVDARVAGLDAGADDYLPKPFDLDELMARLRALVRRSQFSVAAADPDAADLTMGLLRVDPTARRTWWGSTEMTLSKTEFDLLELLVRNRGQVLTHSVIYDRIWQYDFGPDSNNLAVYISYLRRKLDAAGAPDLIRTVRGVGYRLDEP